MIRVVMLGRLGNNLFQYAFGRALAEKHGVPMVMDASWFGFRSWSYVEPLRRLPGLSGGVARVARPFSIGSRLLQKISGKHHWEYLGVPVIKEDESDQSFDPSLLEAPADCVVFGYFQTPLYFADIEPLLRQELSTSGLGLENGHEDLAGKLKNPGAVAVHVRRTDYINNPNLVSLGLGYYRRAMDSIRSSVPDARFHIFSDDPAWCAHEFKGGDIEVAMHSDPFSPLTDLHLMSLASHHIIANSSYSWWAAWLGKKDGQQVLMPDAWFSTGIQAPALEKRMPGWSVIPVRHEDDPVPNE
ncbi:MAG: alpha-1,2-fucosyltransferase [Luteolibacter sp.]